MTSAFTKGIAAVTIVGIGTGIAITSMPETVRSSSLYWNMSTVMNTGLRKVSERDHEIAHTLAIAGMKYGFSPVDINVRKLSKANSTNSNGNERMKIKVWDRVFINPVGMPAGYDRDAEVLPQVFDLGFSFVEVGSVTPLPQQGNPRPRIFRLAEDRAVISRCGIDSKGHDTVLKTLISKKKELRDDVVVGVNLARNTETKSNNPFDDYVKGVNVFGPHVDFIVLNLSCPEAPYTKNLVNSPAHMGNLIKNVKAAHDKISSSESNTNEKSKSRKPALLLKISPDMDDTIKDFMINLIIDQGIDGVIIADATTTRPAELENKWKEEKGGLSGKPLSEKSLKLLKDFYVLTKGKVPLIAVGGISSGEDAYKRIRAGASLVQVYTGMIFEGPILIPRIKDELEKLLIRDGFSSVADAVGIDSKQ